MLIFKKLLPFAIVLSLIACSSNNQKEVNQIKNDKIEHYDSEHNARTSLDWNGVYEGIIPCASCEGIKLTLTLNEDQTFMLKQVYLKGAKTFIAPITKGNFVWDKNGSIIHLKATNQVNSDSYDKTFFVGENHVIVYGVDGKPIKFNLNYTLKKIK